MQHIVLVVIDCLRADHVSAYGYGRATTPTIDRLASRGICWTRAYSPSSWTKPAVTSLLTGRYPKDHGVFRGVKRRAGPGPVIADALSPEVPTLAETLAGAGWHCAAFVNNVQVGRHTNIGRGFTPFVPDAGKADRVLEQFGHWFRGYRRERTFSYLHFLEAHWPYRPRRRHVALFGGDRDRNRFADYGGRDYARLRREIKLGHRRLTTEELHDLVLMYDAAVRRLDGKVKILLRSLAEHDTLDHCAVFITADHGEELLDHGLIGHGHALTEPLTHVPLVAKAPGLEPGRREDAVTLVDVMPTVLALAGVPGADPERSLIARPLRSRPVFAELLTGRRYTQAIWRGTRKLVRQYKISPAHLKAGNAVWLRPDRLAAGAPAVCKMFDLTRDLGERHNLFGDGTSQACSECIDELDAWWQASNLPGNEFSPVEVEVDHQVLRRLRDLGYVE